MKIERKQKVYIPKKPRITTSNKEVHTVYFQGYSKEYDGDDYIVNRNTRKEGYLVSYAYEHWCIGYEEPDFGEGNIATFCSFRSALNWINKYGKIDCYGHDCHYFIESDKYVYTAFNVLKPITPSSKRLENEKEQF